MSHLILVRHGQSEWNAEKRFTGWVDVGLTNQGEFEASKAGELIKSKKIELKHFYCSIQKRSINTMLLILKTLKIKNNIVTRAWELNERHYGALTGLNKEEMKKKYGEDKILEFRRSWNVTPEPLDRNSPFHPLNITTYRNIPRDKIPDTESLEKTYNRVIPYYKKNIMPLLKKENVLIVAHGNSLRGLCKFLFGIDKKKISKFGIPTGNPLVIDMDKETKILGAEYLDLKRSKDLIFF